MKKENQNEEARTEDFADVQKLQDDIVKNSTEFEKLGRHNLKGSSNTLATERKRIKETLKAGDPVQCEACNQEVKEFNEDFVPAEDVNKWTTHKEATRIKKEAKTGTVCNCCGQEAKIVTHTLDWKKALSLIEIYKYFRHSPDAKESEYYSTEHYFGEDQGEYAEIFADYQSLHFWDLIARMPTRPDIVVYKDGWNTITENGIKFVQREVGVPKTAYSYNGEIDGYESDFTTIEDLLKEVDLDYNEMIKVD